MDRFYITRVDNGERLGDNLFLETCRQLVNEASDDVLCTGNEFMDRFYITRVENGERLGNNLSLENCRQLL